MVTFGGLTFPHVLNIQITSAHAEIERSVPMRTIAYRANKAELGRTVKVDGEIRETNTDTVRVAIDALRAFVDGIERSLDLEDGTTAFDALLTDPEYTLDVEGWLENHKFSVDGRFYVPYSVSLLEVTAP
jgi:hypothetical protein